MKVKSLLFLFIFLVIVSSCGEKAETSGDKSETNVTESSGKEEAGKEDSKDSDLQKNEVADPEADAQKTNELGMTAGMPADFPADVPQPLNSKVIGSLVSTDGTMVTFESKDKVQEIITFYKEEMSKSGYEITEDGELITPDKGGLINWSKKGKEVQLVLGYDKDKNISSLVITYK